VRDLITLSYRTRTNVINNDELPKPLKPALGLSLCWQKPYYCYILGQIQTILIKSTTVAHRSVAWDGLAGFCRELWRCFGLCGLRHMHDSEGMRVMAISVFGGWGAIICIELLQKYYSSNDFKRLKDI
jgi:hypothetical protein